MGALIYPRYSHAIPAGAVHRPLLATGRKFPASSAEWAAAFPTIAAPIGLWPLQDATPSVPTTLAAADAIGSVNLTSNANGDEYYQQTGDPYGRYSVYLEDLGSTLRAVSSSSLDQTTGDFSVLFRTKSVGSPISGQRFARKKSISASTNGWAVQYLSNSGHLSLIFDTPAATESTSNIAVNHADGSWHDVLAIINRTGALLTLISDLGSTSVSISAHAGSSVSEATRFGLGDTEGNLNICARVQYSYFAFFGYALTSGQFDTIRGVA